MQVQDRKSSSGKGKTSKDEKKMALRDSVIAAFAETEIQFRSGKEPFSLAGEIMDSLLTDTGFEKSDIDGMIVTPSVSAASTAFWAQSVVDFLGLELDFTDTCDLGGCGAAGSVVRAAAAIDAGLCSTVLVLCADAPSSRFDYVNYSFHEEWTDPYGLMGPPGSFGLLSKRYDHQYGLDLEVLAKLAITQRNHAILNDNACSKLRSPITVDDYMCSRMIADPIRLLDCVMFADGANGLLVTRRAIAKAKGLDRFVVPIGYGEVTNFGGASSQMDITATGHAKAGQRAFAQAGLTPDRIASFHPYDDFLIAIMLQFEMLGFCAPGQGAPSSANATSPSTATCRSTQVEGRFPPGRRGWRAAAPIWWRRCGNCWGRAAPVRSATPTMRSSPALAGYPMAATGEPASPSSWLPMREAP